MVARDAPRIAPFGGRPILSLYDLLLLAIPFAFFVGAVGAGLLGYPLATGFKAGGLLAVVPTVYALFGAPPTGGRTQSGSAQ
ncbi:putative membrane protein [Halanaeroarchaeum sp. HSR-CO]|nr:putative membrane protein [Halanaeroarchaeum sp. HSR-CO]